MVIGILQVFVFEEKKIVYIAFTQFLAVSLNAIIPAYCYLRQHWLSYALIGLRSKAPSLAIEINTVGSSSSPTKKRGVVIRSCSATRNY